MSTEWKTVPVTPTPEMLIAGSDGNPTDWNDGTDPIFAEEVAGRIWRAMLSAAPEAPAEAVAWQWEAFQGGCWETHHSRKKPNFETWRCETRNLRPLYTHPASQAAVRAPEAETLLPDIPLSFTYRNHRGDVAVRSAVPLDVRWGSTEWHREPQWLMRALDVDKGVEREFAMRDMSALDLSAPQAAVRVKPLEWRCINGDKHQIAHGLLSTYVVFQDEFSCEWWTREDAGKAVRAENVDAAKAAAQAVEERRILSALELSTIHDQVRPEAPARTYEDGVRDAAKVAEEGLDEAYWSASDADTAREIAAVIRSLIQGEG